MSGVFKMESIPEHERLHPEAVVKELAARGHQAELLQDADAIVDGIAPELAPGDVVAILSNGGFGGIYQKLPERLRGLSAASQS
jgi:UDP-N-acetylmuramate: L-alanyl-gamma-D-glutamyl-meso-diaminopimelate ligase